MRSKRPQGNSGGNTPPPTAPQQDSVASAKPVEAIVSGNTAEASKAPAQVKAVAKAAPPTPPNPVSEKPADSPAVQAKPAQAKPANPPAAEPKPTSSSSSTD